MIKQEKRHFGLKIQLVESLLFRYFYLFTLKGIIIGTVFALISLIGDNHDLFTTIWFSLMSVIIGVVVFYGLLLWWLIPFIITFSEKKGAKKILVFIGLIIY